MFGSVIAYSFCLESSYKHRTLYGRQFAGSDNQMLGKYIFAKDKPPLQHDRVYGYYISRQLLNEFKNQKSPCMLYRAARGDVVRRCEPSKNRFFLITQPAEPQVGCCLATLLVLLASLLVLLVLLGSVLGQLAAL